MFGSFEGIRFVELDNPHQEFSYVSHDEWGRKLSETTGWENRQTGNGEKTVRCYRYCGEEMTPIGLEVTHYEREAGSTEWVKVNE